MNETIRMATGDAWPGVRTGLLNLGHWLRFLWPAMLVLGGGWLFFADAVRSTIESTPHPALVYTIFGACGVALLSAMLALRTYLYELNLAQELLDCIPEVSRQRWSARAGYSVFAPVYDLVLGQTRLSADSRQGAVNTELEAAEMALDARLEFSNFLGGALVGLGLVGTFVGLLGTLDDLSLVFGTLVNSGSSTVSPTTMFADMVAKLQAPMRGMGTAFVASLYGLLGSLVITLMLVAARKTQAAMQREVYTLVRRRDYGLETVAVSPGQAPVKMADVQALAQAVEAVAHGLREQDQRLAQQSLEVQDVLRQMLTSMHDSAQAHGRQMAQMLDERQVLGRQLSDVLQQNQQQQVVVQGQIATALREIHESTLQVGQGQYAAERTVGASLGELNAVVRQLQQRYSAAVQKDSAQVAQLLEQLGLCQKSLIHSAAALTAATQRMAPAATERAAQL